MATDEERALLHLMMLLTEDAEIAPTPEGYRGRLSVLSVGEPDLVEATAPTELLVRCALAERVWKATDDAAQKLWHAHRDAKTALHVVARLAQAYQEKLDKNTGISDFDPTAALRGTEGER